MHHPYRQGRSTIAGRFDHLSKQQGSHGIIHSTNHGVLTVGASTDTLNATGMELQNVPITMKRVLATDMAILLQTSKVIHYRLP